MTESGYPSVADIAHAIESWAPPATAQSYDNVGLQVGRSTQAVRRAMIALDCTPEVVQQAREARTDLVISHHPLVFRPLSGVNDHDLVSATVLSLAEAGIALYSAHTNLDAARGGVSFALARQLGLEGLRFLQPLDGDVLQKLVVFVPQSHVDAVREAVTAAGAGHIGAYEGCAFETRGTGHFRPTENASPFIGSAGGGPEQVEEIRLETEVTTWRLPAVLAAMRSAHPYEEIAYDLVPLRQPYRDAGVGATGHLAEPEPLSEFLARVASALNVPTLRYVGRESASIRNVAVCGGSGSDFIRVARSGGFDAYVTGDITYHRFFEALQPDGTPGMALIDAGHYETEAATEALLRDVLSEQFPRVNWLLAPSPTSPIRTFIR